MAHGTSPAAPAKPAGELTALETDDRTAEEGKEGEGETGGGAASRAAAPGTARPGNGAGPRATTGRVTDDHRLRPSSWGRRSRSETVDGSGLGLRERPARPLPRQGCCASLRDGLRPPLTPEPLPGLGSVLRAGQEPAPACPRSPSPRRCSNCCSNSIGAARRHPAELPGQAAALNGVELRNSLGRGLKIGRSAVRPRPWPPI